MDPPPRAHRRRGPRPAARGRPGRGAPTDLPRLRADGRRPPRREGRPATAPAGVVALATARSRRADGSGWPPRWRARPSWASAASCPGRSGACEPAIALAPARPAVGGHRRRPRSAVSPHATTSSGRRRPAAPCSVPRACPRGRRPRGGLGLRRLGGSHRRPGGRRRGRARCERGAAGCATACGRSGPRTARVPSLSVFPDGQAGLSYHDPAADPYRCAAGSSPGAARPRIAAPGRTAGQTAGRTAARASPSGTGGRRGLVGSLGGLPARRRGPGRAPSRHRPCARPARRDGRGSGGFEYEVPGRRSRSAPSWRTRWWRVSGPGSSGTCGSAAPGWCPPRGRWRPLWELGDYP